MERKGRLGQTYSHLPKYEMESTETGNEQYLNNISA